MNTFTSSDNVSLWDIYKKIPVVCFLQLWHAKGKYHIHSLLLCLQVTPIRSAVLFQVKELFTSQELGSNLILGFSSIAFRKIPNIYWKNNIIKVH